MAQPHISTLIAMPILGPLELILSLLTLQTIQLVMNHSILWLGFWCLAVVWDKAFINSAEHRLLNH